MTTPYFVFLKAKRGEFNCLVDLDPSTRERLVPVLELVPPPPARQVADRPPQPPRTIEEQVELHIRNIAQSCSTCHPVLVDFTHLSTPMTDGRHPASIVMSRLRSMHVRASPILRPSTVSIQLIQALNDADCVRDGIALRLSPTDLDSPPEFVEVILSRLNVESSWVDAIVDFGPIGDSGALQRGMMNAALTVQRQLGWRSLSLGGSSFPPSLTPYDAGEYRFQRHEWIAWNQLDHAGGSLGYADYGMRAPPLPVEGGQAPIPNLRYTTGDEWFVLKAKAAENRFYADLALDLIHNSSMWMGADHSAGCAAIARCAAGDKGKTAEQAIQFAMTHHLTRVTQQLAN